MTDNDPIPADEPEHADSSMVQLIEEMQLFGYRPFEDEPDQRPLPESRLVDGAVADMFDGLVSALSDTRIEPDLEDLLWGMVNVFQRAVERVDRELDGNEMAQKRMQREQDGSEVKSVELERTIAEGITMIERRDTSEAARHLWHIHHRIFVKWSLRRQSCGFVAWRDVVRTHSNRTRALARVARRFSSGADWAFAPTPSDVSFEWLRRLSRSCE